MWLFFSINTFKKVSFLNTDVPLCTPNKVQIFCSRKFDYLLKYCLFYFKYLPYLHVSNSVRPIFVKSILLKISRSILRLTIPFKLSVYKFINWNVSAEKLNLSVIEFFYKTQLVTDWFFYKTPPYITDDLLYGFPLYVLECYRVISVETTQYLTI